MKHIIDFGLTILLFGLVTKNLPFILKNVRKGQVILLKESSVSNWGKAWVPKSAEK